MADTPSSATFGKKPPRLLQSFGVAGLLSEKAKVFYSSVFTTQHIGRVTDLIAAKFHGEGLDELRLRALILFGTFEVFRSQGEPNAAAANSDRHLAEPLVVECGLDEDKVAVGISFTPDEGEFPKLEGLAPRILAGEPQGSFEAILAQIHTHAHWVVVRAQPALRRLEIVALLGIPGKMEAEALNLPRAGLQVVEMGADQKPATPPVSAYIELGDLNYPELLQEEVAVKGNAVPATGEILMHGFKEADDAIKVRAAELMESLAVTSVKGKKDEKIESIIVKGDAPSADNDAVMIKGGTPASGEENYVVKGGSAGGTNEDEEEEVEASGTAIQGVFAKVKKVWPFRFGKNKADENESASDAGPESESEIESAAAANAAALAPDPTVSASAPDAEKGSDEELDEEGEREEAAAVTRLPVVHSLKISTDDIEKEAQKLTREIETGIEKTVNRAQSEAGELKKEMGSTRAKRWVDGLMSELVVEKARLAEASKALNTSIRQKEIEFRTKEQILTEELKRRDDLLRQKSNALNRAKEQLAQAAISAERLKTAKAGAVDDAHYKQKHALVQKMLTATKEENAGLLEKINELKNQVLSAHVNATKRAGPSATDFTALQSKYERTLRQTEEIKKTNQQLLDKLAEVKKDRVTAPQEDAKKRIDAAMKLAAGFQRDSEKLQVRVEEMQREQLRLQAELRTARPPAKPAGTPAPSVAKSMKPAVPAPAAKPAVPAPAAKPAVPAPAAKPAAPAPAPAKPTAAAKPPAGGKSNPPKAA